MNVCVFWGRDVGRWKEGSAKTQLPMRALLRHSIQKTSLRRYRPSGFVMDQLVKRRPEVDSFSHHVGELNSNSQSSRTLNRYETGHKRERRAFAVIQFYMYIYIYMHEYIHTYVHIFMYLHPRPVFIWFLCSKHAFKDLLSLTPVDLFMSILPPTLRHTEFVRLVLTLPQGVRKCFSYLDAH